MTKQQTDIQSFSDQELISLYQQKHNAQYIATLYQRYSHLIFGVCLKYVNKLDAEDLSVDVFEVLLDKLKTGEINSFPTWLHVITRNQCLMHLRKTAREQRAHQAYLDTLDIQADVYIPDYNEQPEEPAKEKLQECMHLLVDEQQKCLQLFYQQNKSYKEIAITMKIAVSEVKSHLQNGKSRLRRMLQSTALLIICWLYMYGSLY